MEEWWEGRMEKFKNQLMRTLYIKPVRLDSSESEREIFNNFKNGINIIGI